MCAIRGWWTSSPNCANTIAADEFRRMGAAALRALGKPAHVLYDLKYVLPAGASDLRL
jgi:UDP-N-acetyl-D-galactosamine dehydrogenase